ncbi:phosphatidylserine decarboxylase-domain-containing protein [Fusarium tricinctum]|uniref:Phosphatidylserine decarboxylase-domain-containing protein n=1 Tax=Fusarium tricinctum TaxID=61284 RepID=A0A8K0RJF9_9HYPO|nr:phosphatidylserine decarboxylase-domain-containing protein [Fusarium tricinctum]
MPSATNNFTKKLQSQTPGLWLPRNKEIILQWVGQKVKQARAQDLPMNPNVQAFADFVKGNTILSSLAELQFTEVPADYHNGNDPVGDPQIRDFNTFILVLNRIIVTGPEFFSVEDPDAMGLIGFPINAVLDWPMGTKAGWTFWYFPEVNRQFQPILQDFEKYLASPASKAILAAPSGWLGATAQAMIVDKANLDGKQRTFTEIFKCPDPSDTTYLGFESWDQFFTREFNDGLRPVVEPTNSSILNNSCESGPLQYKQNVQASDRFLLKGQPYSLENMLNFDQSRVQQFKNGSVYQAFVSALSYHRWSSPVNGTVVDYVNVPGTYYSESPFQGFPNPDPNAANNSQPYISSVATRGIIYIQAEGPIGLMAIVYVGMAEVSSCEFTVTKGQPIKKGDELGMFHFGGSTHCMVFRPDVKLIFNQPPGAPGDDGTWNWGVKKNLPLNGALALVTNES